MLQYILKRAIWSVPVLLAVTVITFMLMHMVPGGPWDANHGDRPISKAVQKVFMERYGLDKPLHIQYLAYISSALRGDLGPSYDDSRPVTRIIAEQFPLSAAFGGAALLIGVLAGIPFGLISALRRNGWFDRLGLLFTTITISLPNFVLAVVLILIFAVNWRLVPVQFQRKEWQSWLLPLGLLALRVFAVIVHFTRDATLNTLGEDYVRTARMKGLGERAINFQHILRNVLLPVVTMLGPLAADLLTGSFIIESIFGIPGLGRTFVTSIISRDYSLLMGVTLFFAVILILFNLLVDLSYGLIDPRISRSSST